MQKSIETNYLDKEEKMKNCKNCYYNNQCSEKGKRCDDYYPFFGEDTVAIRDYKNDLKERASIYKELIDESQDNLKSED